MLEDRMRYVSGLLDICYKKWFMIDGDENSQYFFTENSFIDNEETERPEILYGLITNKLKVSENILTKKEKIF